MAHPCCGHGDRRRLPFVPRTVVTRGKGWGRVGRGVGISRDAVWTGGGGMEGGPPSLQDFFFRGALLPQKP